MWQVMWQSCDIVQIGHFKKMALVSQNRGAICRETTLPAKVTNAWCPPGGASEKSNFTMTKKKRRSQLVMRYERRESEICSIGEITVMWLSVPDEWGTVAVGDYQWWALTRWSVNPLLMKLTFLLMSWSVICLSISGNFRFLWSSPFSL